MPADKIREDRLEAHKGTDPLPVIAQWATGISRGAIGIAPDREESPLLTPGKLRRCQVSSQGGPVDVPQSGNRIEIRCALAKGNQVHLGIGQQRIVVRLHVVDGI